MSDRKDLPPASASNFLARVREELAIMMGNRGEPLDQTVRFRDLQNSALMRIDPAFLAGNNDNRPIISGPGPAVPPMYLIDLTPPPTPTGFTVSAAISNLMVQHDAALFTAGHGYLRTVLYGASRTSMTAPAPTFANSVELTQFVGTVAAYPTNPSTIWHLWIKWVSVDGVLSESPAGGTNGVSVTTAVDVTRLVAALTGPGNPFKVVTTSYTLADGTVVPVGTYTSDAYMGSFVAARGQIGLLAVDDARIANLNVSKLKAGSISVGEFITSSGYVPGSAGWSINGNGQAEFSGVVVRGTVYASAGQIGGNRVDATGVESPSYTAGTSGWRLDSTGVIRAFAPGDRIFDMAATGTMPVLKAGTKFYVLADGSAFFGGSLAANTVTADTIVSESIGKPFAFSSYPQPDTGAIGGGALTNANGMTPLLVIGPRNAVAGYLFGTASVSGAYLVSDQFGTLTTKLLVEEYTGTAGTGTVTAREALFQTATAADSRVSGVNVYAMPVTVFAFALAASTKSVKITFSARNNNPAQVAYISNIAVAGAVLQR